MYILVRKGKVIHLPPNNKKLTHQMGIYEVPADQEVNIIRRCKKGAADIIPDSEAKKKLADKETARLKRMKAAAEKKKADAEKKKGDN